MHGETRILNKAVILAIVLAILGCSGFKCPLIKDKEKERTVTMVDSAVTIKVKTAADSMTGLEEYNMVYLCGVVPPPPGKDFTSARRLLTDSLLGKKVKVDGERRNGRDEIVAYVFVGGKLINAELLRQGLGRFGMTHGDERYADQLKAAEAEAKAAGLGIWADQKEQPKQEGFDSTPKYDRDDSYEYDDYDTDSDY